MSQWNYQLIRDSQEIDRYLNQPVMYKRTGQVFKGLHQYYSRLVRSENPTNCTYPGHRLSLHLKSGAL